MTARKVQSIQYFAIKDHKTAIKGHTIPSQKAKHGYEMRQKKHIKQ